MNPLKVWTYCMGVVVIIAMFVTLWSGLGMGALVSELADGNTELNSTIDDYSAVEKIELEEDSIKITTSDTPRFSSQGDWGKKKITDLRLVTSDGSVNKRSDVVTGQTIYTFPTGDTIDGNYTLALIHYEAPDPGLFGHPEREYEQIIKFEISSGKIVVTEVPYSPN